MHELRHIYPPDREVMKGIDRSFYPAARIAILGEKCSGKSSLLKIMAGLDDDFTISVVFYDPGLDLNSLVAGTTCDFVHPYFDVFQGHLSIFTQTWIACATATGAITIMRNTNAMESAAVLIQAQERPAQAPLGAGLSPTVGVLALVLQDDSEDGQGVYPALYRLVHQLCG